MNQFFSVEGAPRNPIIISSDSDSETSSDGGVMLPTSTPTSDYFSLHEGPTHNNLPPSLHSGNRIEAWFKGVYGDAGPHKTESCASSTDSEPILYYDADSELSEEDLAFTDSDSVSFTSYPGSDFYEWKADRGPYTSDPAMGSYNSDSDSDNYIWDSELDWDTSESCSDPMESDTGSDTSHSFNGLRMPPYAVLHGRNIFSGAYESDPGSPSSSDGASGSDTDSYSSDLAYITDSNPVVGTVSLLALQARLQLQLRLMMAESRTRMQENFKTYETRPQPEGSHGSHGSHRMVQLAPAPDTGSLII